MSVSTVALSSGRMLTTVAVNITTWLFLRLVVNIAMANNQRSVLFVVRRGGKTYAVYAIFHRYWLRHFGPQSTQRQPLDCRYRKCEN